MMLVYTSQYVKKNMKTKLGVEFEIDFAHTLRGHPKCGKPHGHTSVSYTHLTLPTILLV